MTPTTITRITVPSSKPGHVLFFDIQYKTIEMEAVLDAVSELNSIKDLSNLESTGLITVK